MNIWLVQRAEPTPHDDNGSRRLLRTGLLASTLAACGHEVSWWTSSFDHTHKRFRHQKFVRSHTSQNYDICYIPTRGYGKNISISRYLDDKVLAANFRKYIREEKEKPDLILASLPSIELAATCIEFGKVNNIPVIIDIRDLYPDVFVDLVPGYLKPLVEILSVGMKRKVKAIMSSAAAITGITEQFVEWGLKQGKRDRSEFDRAFFMAYQENEKSTFENFQHANEKLSHLKSNRPILRLAFLGSFTKSFDFKTVFDAADLILKDGECEGVEFVFAGKGKYEGVISSECSARSNCNFLGWLNKDEINHLLSISDIGLAPYVESDNFINNIPNKPAEYLSSGLIIATSLTSGPLVKLINKNDIGFSFGKSPLTLASKIKNLYFDNSKLKIMKSKAKKIYMQNFNADIVYRSLAAYLEGFIEEISLQDNMELVNDSGKY